MKVKNIPVDKIKYPDVVLRSPEDMSGIDELARSISENGLINPLTVKTKGEDYILLAGGRRFEAIKKLGWETVPCHIISASEKAQHAITLIENQQRADLNPLEEAQYYEYLQQTEKLTQEQIGKLAGTTAAHVNQMLKLLTLDEYTMGALASGDISASQARELTRLPDVKYRQYLVDIIKRNGATVSVLRRWVDQRIGQTTQKEEYQPAPVYVEPADGGEEVKVRCDLCGQEKNINDLRSTNICDPCFGTVKKAMELSELSGDEPQSPKKT